MHQSHLEANPASQLSLQLIHLYDPLQHAPSEPKMMKLALRSFAIVFNWSVTDGPTDGPTPIEMRGRI